MATKFGKYLGLDIQTVHQGEYCCFFLLCVGSMFMKISNNTEKGRAAIRKYRNKGRFIFWQTSDTCIITL